MVLFEVDALQIAGLGQGDAPGLLETYRQCEDFLALGPVPRASIEMIRGDMAHSQSLGGQFCGIEDAQGQVIGVLDFVPDTGSEGVAFIELLMIAGPWRRRGIGRRVVTSLEGYLKANHGVHTVEAAVQANNPDAMRFWAALGYRQAPEAVRQADGTVTHRLSRVVEP
jgi:RimJ/RimL family protein N-acetyltransferase